MHAGQGVRVAEPLRDGTGLLELCQRRPSVALQQRPPRVPGQGDGHGGGRLVRQGDRLIQPVAAFGQGTGDQPVGPGLDEHLHRHRSFGGVGEAKLQGGLDVGPVRLQPGVPVQLVRAEPLGVGPFGQPAEVVPMPATEFPLFSGGDQALRAVLANRFQHPVPGPGAMRFVHHDGLVHQPGHQVDDVGRLDMAAGAYGFEVAAAGEHGEAGPQRLLRFRAQPVTPVDGRPQRLLAGQRRAAPAGQEPEPVIKPVDDLLDGERSYPYRGQFDGQRNAVKPLAQTCDRAAVLRSDREVGFHLRGAVGEEKHRFGTHCGSSRHVVLVGDG